MKKLFILITAAMMTISTISSAVTIPQNINGVRLGISTQKEVGEILQSNGLEFSMEESDSTNYIYRGRCKHEDMDFSTIVTRYYMDTIIFMGFYGMCDSACTDYGKSFLQRVHSKYETLEHPDSSMYYASLTADADSLGLTKWGRKDDKSLVITLNNDTLCLCFYFAEDRMQKMMLNALFNLIMEITPDYAEENKVYGVAGVKFGDSKESVKRVIYTKSAQLLESDSHKMTFAKVKVGGSEYTYADFYFKPEKGLVAVNLSKSFQSWQEEEAKVFYDIVVTQYKNKYTNFRENEKKDYAFCGAYTDDYKDMPPIVISRKKSLSRGGDMLYYVEVSYYLQSISGLYDDEI